MSVLLHPNKTAPQRYRVWDKMTRTQKYFPLTPSGKREAESFYQKVLAKKHAIKMRAQLDINKLFYDDGRVKGLSRRTRMRNGREYEYLCAQVTLPSGKQTNRQTGLAGKSFDECYWQAIDKLLELQGLKMTAELKFQFNQAKRYYW